MAASTNGPGSPQLPQLSMLSTPVHQGKCPPTHVAGGRVGLKADMDCYGGENILRPPAFEPRTFRPVMNRHADDAIPAADISTR